ncbi:hypothetical protein AAII07_30895 [Microvirga sp. 0TCS3.31]
MSDQARMGSTVLSRRAAVRGAVWSIPAVTVATTAPAFANTSGGMALTGFTAAYAASDRLVISGTVVAGSAANAGTLTFTIEPNLVGSVAVVAGATGAVVPTSGGGFSITYPVTPGSFTTTLDLGEDDLAGLFKGYRGEQTFLLADIEPSVSDPETIPVAQLPRSTVEPVQAEAAWISYTAVRVAASGLRLTAQPQPSVGRLRIAMTVPTAVYNNPNPPTVSNLAPGWMVDPLNTVRHWGGGWTLRFVTTQEAHTSLTADAAHRGVGDFSVDLDHDSTGFFEASRVLVDITTDETGLGWGEDDFKIDVQQPYVVLGPRPAAPA